MLAHHLTRLALAQGCIRNSVPPPVLSAPAERDAPAPPKDEPKPN